MPNSSFFCGRSTIFFGSRHCLAVFFSQVPKKCTDLFQTLFYILILGIYSKFARKIIFLRSAFAQRLSIALLERWPQVCHVKITFTVLPTNHFRCFHNNKNDEMHCKLDSTENLRSFQKHPTLSWLIEFFINESIKRRRFCAAICEKKNAYYINTTNCPPGLSQRIWLAAHFVW